MIYEQTLRVLGKLLEATKAGALSWEKDDQGDWYTARANGREFNIRFLYFEATNQAGADRHSIQVSIPGFSGFFSSGSQGYCLLLEVLAVAFEEHGSATDSCGKFAIEFIDAVIDASS